MEITEVPACPMSATRDDRKSAALAAQRTRVAPGARVIGGFEVGRAILRCAQMLQAGVGAEQMNAGGGEYLPVFFLDGDSHRRRRTSIARFFTPKAIIRYRQVMERTSDELLGRLQARGGGRLDDLSYLFAVAVAAEVIGLTSSDRAGMAKRIQGTLHSTRLRDVKPVIIRAGAQLLTAVYGLCFFVRDVRPAIRARRRQRREDVISHLIDEGYPDQAILIECMTYAVAGMLTTREFIVMAAWHMFDDDALRTRFTVSDEAEQVAILEEILRLEPVTAMLHRRAAADCALGTDSARDGELLAVDIRAANVDPQAVGEHPHRLDPDRSARLKAAGSFLSFGDGSHRCPGAQVAIAESRVFLDRLMRLPGLRLRRAPDLTWCDALMSYELRGAVVTCARS